MELTRGEVLREGPNSGVRVFLDEDQESYFDLSVERLPDSELFEVQISFSSPSEVDEGNLILASEERVGTVENLFNQIRPVDEQPLLEDSIEILSQVSCLELKILSRFKPSSFGVDDGLFSCKPSGQKPKSLRKPSNLASVIHDRVARFFVKFPSKKVGNTFMSALRSFTSKGLKDDNLLEKNTSSSSFVFPLNKWMPSRKRMKVKDSSSNRPSFSQNKGNSSADCLRSGNRFMNFRSCPSSIMSSPSYGFYKDRGIFEKDCVINAAIAHCKLSFHGANSER